MASLRSTSKSSDLATSVATLVVAAPAGMSAGDVVAVFIVFNSVSATVTAAFTTSANALTQEQLCRSGAQASGALFRGVVQAADVGNTITFTFSVAVRSAGFCYCLQNVDNTTPVRVSGQTAGPSAAATPSPTMASLAGVLGSDFQIVAFCGRPSAVTGRPAAYVASGATTGWAQDGQDDNGTTSSFDPAVDCWSIIGSTAVAFADQFQIPSGTNVLANWAIVQVAFADAAAAAAAAPMVQLSKGRLGPNPRAWI